MKSVGSPTIQVKTPVERSILNPSFARKPSLEPDRKSRSLLNSAKPYVACTAVARRASMSRTISKGLKIANPRSVKIPAIDLSVQFERCPGEKSTHLNTISFPYTVAGRTVRKKRAKVALQNTLEKIFVFSSEWLF